MRPVADLDIIVHNAQVVRDAQPSTRRRRDKRLKAVRNLSGSPRRTVIEAQSGLEVGGQGGAVKTSTHLSSSPLMVDMRLTATT